MDGKTDHDIIDSILENMSVTHKGGNRNFFSSIVANELKIKGFHTVDLIRIFFS